MSRQIIYDEKQPPPGPVGLNVQKAKQGDQYSEMVVKLVPADVVASYIAAIRVIEGSVDNDLTACWWVFGFALVMTPITQLMTGVRGKIQIFASTVAFAIWAFAWGTPFNSLKAPSFLPSLLLIGYTFFVPYLFKRHKK